MHSLPTPSEIISHLDRYVRGQERAKQDIAVAVYNHYLSQAVPNSDGTDMGRHHIFYLEQDLMSHLRRMRLDTEGVSPRSVSSSGMHKINGYCNRCFVGVRCLQSSGFNFRIVIAGLSER